MPNKIVMDNTILSLCTPGQVWQGNSFIIKYLKKINRFRAVTFSVLCTAFFLGILCATFADGQSAPVPQVYQDLYSSLGTQISTFDSTIKAGWNGAPSPVLYAPQLENAASAQFTQLISPNYYQFAVMPELEKLQALGAKAVKIQISFPILYQPFYSSNPSQYNSFVSFYQQLAADVHARGMKLIVESCLANVYPGDNASSFAAYYKTLTWSQYMTGRAQNALNTALLIKPDYMSVITEPDTEAAYTGQTNANTVSGATQLLQQILNTLAAGGVTQLPIGAGAGTWLGNFSQYIQAFAALPVEYIDMHLFLLNNNYPMNALSGADMAHAAGKQVAMSAAWDFKLRNSEVGQLTLVQTSSRDPFTFWEPIDTAFLQTLSDLANYKQFLFVSPYWSQYFSAYLDYNTYGSLSTSQVIVDANTAFQNAVASGAVTPTGLAWLNLQLPSPDVIPPVVSPPVASAIYPTAIPLTWPAATDNVGTAGYVVYRNGAPLATTALLVYSDTGLIPGATYTYQLKAFDASGNMSALSSPLTVETTDTTPPSVPTNVQVVGATKNSVSLSWSPSTGIGGVGGYRVLKGTSPSSMSIVANPTTTSYTDPWCKPGVTYYYSVKSFNPLGITSAASAIVQVTTP